MLKEKIDIHENFIEIERENFIKCIPEEIQKKKYFMKLKKENAFIPKSIIALYLSFFTVSILLLSTDILMSLIKSFVITCFMSIPFLLVVFLHKWTHSFLWDHGVLDKSFLYEEFDNETVSQESLIKFKELYGEEAVFNLLNNYGDPVTYAEMKEEIDNLIQEEKYREIARNI